MDKNFVKDLQERMGKVRSPNYKVGMAIGGKPAKTPEEHIFAAMQVATTICDNSFNCVGADGKPRCHECKMGDLYIALGVLDKNNVGKANDAKCRRLFLGGFLGGLPPSCKGCQHAKEQKTRLSGCPNFKHKKAR